MKGKFITFEGGEGCGKTTLINELKQYLDEKSISYISVRDPGGPGICDEIRNMVKYNTQKIGKRAEVLLFSASRAELVDEVILPSLKLGKIVLCDRFLDSMRVYQGYANGLSDSDILMINKFATDNLLPDLTFYLDIDSKFAFERKGGRDKGDRIENRNDGYHEKIREGYLNFVRKESRIVLIDASKSKEEILTQVIEKLKEEKII